MFYFIGPTISYHSLEFPIKHTFSQFGSIEPQNLLYFFDSVPAINEEEPLPSFSDFHLSSFSELLPTSGLENNNSLPDQSFEGSHTSTFNVLGPYDTGSM